MRFLSSFSSFLQTILRERPQRYSAGASHVGIQQLEARCLLTSFHPFDLNSLDGSNGFRMTLSDSSAAFWDVSDAGDVNGDGFDDVLLGADVASASYVVFGKASGFNPNVNLSALDGTDGFRIRGISDFAGTSVSRAGDVNGDGFGDVIVGAPENGAAGFFSGRSYILFGKAANFSATVEVSSLTGNDGWRLDSSIPFEGVGTSVSGAGDVNGDGFDDVIVGAGGAGGFNGTTAAATYVVFGKSGPTSPLTLANLDGDSGFSVDPINGVLNVSVSRAGDMNGDGFDDVVFASGNKTYVVFGKPSNFPANFDLSTLNGSTGFSFDGGSQVSDAGDVNGDGFDDVIVGDTSRSYVIFGKGTGFAPTLAPISLNGTNGFRIDEAAVGDSAGTVSSAGDVNGDGVDDLLIGAFNADPDARNNAGQSYVVFGKTDPFSAFFILGDIDGTNGFRIDGLEANDRLGISVSNTGDLNNDGFEDIVVSELRSRGDIYVIFGGDGSISPRQQTPDAIGVHRGTRFYQDANGNRNWDGVTAGDILKNFNVAGTPLIGDWDGDGFDEIGIHSGANFYLDANANGRWDGPTGGDVLTTFGNNNDTPIVGDWNGDGIDSIGVHRGTEFFLDVNGNGVWDGQAIDRLSIFSIVGGTPIIGDWNGDGSDAVGIHRGRNFYRDVNGNGQWDVSSDVVTAFGNTGDTPIVGDWNGDGFDSIGTHSDRWFSLDFDGNGVWDGPGIDARHVFGTAGDTPIIGRWKPVNQDSIGINRGTRFYRDATTNGLWDGVEAGDVLTNFLSGTPVIGDWNNDGFDEIGTRIGEAFYLDANANGAWDGAVGGDVLSTFNISGGTPIVGDWNGDGSDKIGVQRGTTFYLDLNANRRWDGVNGGDRVQIFNVIGTAIIGDWNGDGRDEIGMHQGANFFRDLNGNGTWDGVGGGDVVSTFGAATDTPIIGDWNGDGIDTIGVHRGRQFYRDVSGNGRWDGPTIDAVSVFGIANDIPIIGRWDRSDGSSPTAGESAGNTNWTTSIVATSTANSVAEIALFRDEEFVLQVHGDARYGDKQTAVSSPQVADRDRWSSQSQALPATDDSDRESTVPNELELETVFKDVLGLRLF